MSCMIDTLLEVLTKGQLLGLGSKTTNKHTKVKKNAIAFN